MSSSGNQMVFQLPVELASNYTVLRPLNARSTVLLCRENASARMLVLKFFSSHEELRFQGELKALVHLQSAGFAPSLFFSGQYSGGLWFLGHCFLPGQLLGSWSVSAPPGDKASVGSMLKAIVHRLHHEFLWAHGDLSPNNILIHAERGDISIHLIDWEYSSSLRGENLAQYSSYRGTPDFTPVHSDVSLVNKDLIALENILRQTQCIAEKNSSEGVRPWWSRLF